MISILSVLFLISAIRMDIDDDTSLDFVWDPASGDPDFYRIYVSVDWGKYKLFGTTPTNSCTIPGEDGHIYRIKVQAATEDGRVGPESDESDPVLVVLNPLGIELGWKVWDKAIHILPSKTRLLQNYPNPAKSETWIPFQLADPAYVRIIIYDLAGRTVRRINLGYRPPGFYLSHSKALLWDGRNEKGERVSSGIYLYEMRADGFRERRRMILVR